MFFFMEIRESMIEGVEAMDIQQVFRDIYSSEPKFFTFCPFCGEKLTMSNKLGVNRPKCLHCDFIQYVNPTPAIVVIIEKDKHILLGKRKGTSKYKPGYWSLPGGMIEYGESFLDAAHREVKEETGLTIELNSIVNVASNFFTKHTQTLGVAVSARIISGTPVPGDDVEELHWHNLAEELPNMAFEVDVFTIRKYSKSREDELSIDPRFKLK
jgi:8-oxo-dGTP diphosphatase